MKEKEVNDCTVFECLGGSHAYGTNIPESDIDIRGVAIIADPAYYIGMGVKEFNQKDKWKDGSDKVIYDFRKAFKLMANCNPNVLDLLFCDQQHHIKCDPAWWAVIESRDLFISKKARYSFGGYSFAQLKRIKRHRSYLLNPPKEKPTRAMFGLPERKLVNSDQAGAYQWLLAKIMKGSVEVMKISPEARQELYGINYIGAIQSGIPEEAAQVVKEITGATDEWVTAVMAEKRYENAMKSFSAYDSWKKNRNKKRQVMEEKYKYDTKHAMHLVRLMRMGMEILETGRVNVFRPDREELVAIRNGAWSYEQVEEYAEDCDKKMDKLYKTSTLPKNPDYNQIDELCQKIISDRVFHG